MGSCQYESDTPNIERSCSIEFLSPLRKLAHAINRDFFQLKKKNENSIRIFFYIFHIFAQNIDCGYALEPPRRGGSNEYPQCMFWSKNKKDTLKQSYKEATFQTHFLFLSQVQNCTIFCQKTCLSSK